MTMIAITKAPTIEIPTINPKGGGAVGVAEGRGDLVGHSDLVAEADGDCVAGTVAGGIQSVGGMVVDGGSGV